MGMCMGLCAVSDATIQRLHADPPLVWRVLAPDDDEPYTAARQAGRGWLERLFGRSVPDPAPVDPAQGDVDLDKSWHGIHYLLTGTAWAGEPPLNFLAGAGQTVGNVDVGYGPARSFSSDEVAAIHAALAPVTRDSLRARFDSDAMAKLDIYPAIWRDEGDGAFDYCADYFDELKAFIADASARGLGLLIHTS
ncbi:YfbM family protein [Arenimonas sp. MALMAid1274]|uniref:YfbM family protein n=1 Tax=Arenimonas sp. MALMAid1274 TaxID=3411630 RepID=UPI003BA25178